MCVLSLFYLLRQRDYQLVYASCSAKEVCSFRCLEGMLQLKVRVRSVPYSMWRLTDCL